MPIDAQPRHYLALAVTIIGIGLLVGSVLGRARWLILLGVIMVPTLLFSPVFESNWTSTDFDQRVRPLTFEQVQPVYDIDLGTLIIDLRSLPWNGEDLTLDAQVDAGELQILLPDDVGIVGSASVDVGQVEEPGRSTGGLGQPTLTWNQEGTAGTVHLDAEVNIGHIQISR